MPEVHQRRMRSLIQNFAAKRREAAAIVMAAEPAKGSTIREASLGK